MAKFVVIKDILNVRSKPVLKDEHFIGSLKFGEVIDLIDEPIPGEIPEGTDDNMWLSDGVPRLVSRAGVALLGSYAVKKAEFLRDDFNKQFIDEADPENESKWKVSWGHVDLEIWRIWKEFNTRGEGVKVAILDFGIIENHPDLQIDKENCFYPLNDGGTFVDTSNDLHGSMCVGICSGSGSKFVSGIAPKASILIARVYDKNNTFSYEGFLKALEWVIKNKTDIISLSFEDKFRDTEIQRLIQQKLVECVNNNIVIVSAIGNKGQLQRPREDVFPACQDQCYAIGAYEKSNTNRYFKTTLSKKLKFLLPGKDVLTITLNSAGLVGENSSIATPTMAGIISLFLSLRKKGELLLSPSEILGNLYKTGMLLEEDKDNETYQFVIPQPYNLLKSIT